MSKTLVKILLIFQLIWTTPSTLACIPHPTTQRNILKTALISGFTFIVSGIILTTIGATGPNAYKYVCPEEYELTTDASNNTICFSSTNDEVIVDTLEPTKKQDGKEPLYEKLEYAGIIALAFGAAIYYLAQDQYCRRNNIILPT
jgi:hypothetical protein